MKEIQMLYKGKVHKGEIAYEQPDFMEISLPDEADYSSGDAIICFDRFRRWTMRVMRTATSRIIVAPVNSEIFQIQGHSPIAYEELYRQEDKVFKSFKLNIFGTISEDFKIRSVRFTDVSRLGFGLEIDDFSVKMNEVYDSMIICDEETIHPKLIVRYAHILEKTIRYGCEIKSISPKDLHKLRCYLLTKQFSQEV